MDPGPHPHALADISRLLALGTLRYQRGNLAGAVQSFRQGLAVDPVQPDLLGNLRRR